MAYMVDILFSLKEVEESIIQAVSTLEEMLAEIGNTISRHKSIAKPPPGHIT